MAEIQSVGLEVHRESSLVMLWVRIHSWQLNTYLFVGFNVF